MLRNWLNCFIMFISCILGAEMRFLHITIIVYGKYIVNSLGYFDVCIRLAKWSIYKARYFVVKLLKHAYCKQIFCITCTAHREDWLFAFHTAILPCQVSKPYSAWVWCNTRANTQIISFGAILALSPYPGQTAI